MTVSSAEVHIAGLLVQVFPRAAGAVERWLSGAEGAELHARQGGRLVVVFEAGSADEVLRFIDRLREQKGVLNIALVYQHSESAHEMEELIDVDQPA